MAHGMLRGAAAAWLGLVALQTFTTDRGAGAVGGLLGTADALVKRALDPSVAAIPDHSKKALPAGDTPIPGMNGVTPNQLRTGAANAGTLLNGGSAALQQINGQIQAINVPTLQQQLGGLSQYTPEQLMQAWGITP